MKFEEAQYNTSFVLPDALTIRQQLTYKGALGARAGQDLFIRAWHAVIPLIDDWQSELIPNPEELDLDTETNPLVADIISWAGIEAMLYIVNLERVEKN